MTYNLAVAWILKEVVTLDKLSVLGHSVFTTKIRKIDVVKFNGPLWIMESSIKSKLSISVSAFFSYKMIA